MPLFFGASIARQARRVRRLQYKIRLMPELLI
jgi:hypothetical protein